jgi:hypothetical protein
MIQCSECKATLTSADGPCPHCGGAVNLSLQLTGARMEIRGGRLGVVRDQRDESGHRIDNSSPGGARSTSVLSSNGAVTGTVAGPVDVGTRGEQRVADTLVACLQARGHVTSIRGGDDHRGEDRILAIDAEQIVLQVVTAPDDKTLWEGVAQGSASREADVHSAAGWIYQAVNGKAARYAPDSKRSMLLAVDIAHFGVLATRPCVDAYLTAYGDPSRHSFTAIWLIGPTVALSAPLGPCPW